MKMSAFQRQSWSKNFGGGRKLTHHAVVWTQFRSGCSVGRWLISGYTLAFPICGRLRRSLNVSCGTWKQESLVYRMSEKVRCSMR